MPRSTRASAAVNVKPAPASTAAVNGKKRTQDPPPAAAAPPAKKTKAAAPKKSAPVEAAPVQKKGRGKVAKAPDADEEAPVAAAPKGRGASKAKVAAATEPVVAAPKRVPKPKVAKVSADEPAAAVAPAAAPKGKASAKGKGAGDAAVSQAKSKVSIPVDPHYATQNAGCTVHEDYGTTLNQTNISSNNNKFYIIQVIRDGASFVCFTRWGRVGERGESQNQSFPTADGAIAMFKSKFKDKTKNKWEDRANFVKHDGKYQLVHIDHAQSTDEIDAAVKKAAPAAGLVKNAGFENTKLDPVLHDFVSLIFSKEMFNASMSDLKIDTTRLPLGALTKQQLREGNETLDELMQAIERKASRMELERLSSRYYSLIPTAVGRTIPPVLETKEMVQQKFDLLAVLGDIDKAQDMEKEAQLKDKLRTPSKLQPNPVDQLYDSLAAELTVIDPSEEIYQVISKFAKNTSSRKVLNIFGVDRKAEDGKAFYDKVANRKLLWHGTNAAVVAAIIKSGLRIMPHSGGRVGRGIYLASENSKSSGYVWPAPFYGKRVGIMFLAEVVLGKEHHITKDDYSLKQAPAGYDSIIAQGRTDPDPAGDVELDIDGRTVVVPCGKVVPRSQYEGSNFSQTEFLVYKEDQHRLRYVVTFQW